MRVSARLDKGWIQIVIDSYQLLVNSTNFSEYFNNIYLEIKFYAKISGLVCVEFKLFGQ